MKNSILKMCKPNLLPVFLTILLLVSVNANSQVPVTAAYGSINRNIDDFYGYNSSSTVRLVSWDTPQLPGALKQLNASVFRFPAGAYANWYDWKKGWFKTADQMPPNVVLPGKYFFNYQFDNSLEKFKESIDSTGATPIFLLNMISSTIEEQIAMLYHAQCIGLPVKNVELGKEFYDDDPSILTVFPTAEVFAEAVYKWTNEIVKHFPGVKVGFNASFEYERFTSPYARRISWNQKIIDVLNTKGGNFPYASSAPSMYIFYGSGNGQSGLPISSVSQVNQLMRTGYSILEHLQTTEVPKFTQFPEMWVSEYNLMDLGTGVHGTWAHGLFTTLVGMRFLEEEKVSKALIHNMIGDATYSSLFESAAGLCYGEGFIPPIPPDSNCLNYPTNYLEKTAQGNAVALMGQAMFRSNKARKINFVNAPFLGGSSYKSVYGFKFFTTNVTGTDQYIILNIGDTSISLDMNALGLTATPAYDQIAGSPFTPIRGNMTINTGNVLGGMVTLPPYSITRVYRPNSSALQAWANTNTICSGKSTSLHARGAVTYTWAPAAGLNTTIGSDVVATPLVNTIYTVTDNYGGAELVQITVAPTLNLTVSGVPPGKTCQGTQLNLNVSGGGNYHWDPKPDSFVTNNQSSVLINPSKSSSYTVYGNNGSCFCGAYTVNINVGGEVTLGKDHLVCEGIADTLVSGANPGYSYSWTSTNGFNSTQFNPVVSVTDTAAFYLAATEGSCVYKDTILLNTMNCCTGNVTVTNPDVKKLCDAVSLVCPTCVTTQSGAKVITNYLGNLVINGILTLDSSLKFKGCPNITFNHAGKVVIPQISKLTLDNASEMRDCNGQMWKGVFAYDALSTITLSNGSVIKNATTAIDATIDTRVVIENSFLINNHVSLYIHDYLKALSCSIAGSTFTCTGPGDMLPPYNGTRTLSHLNIERIAKGTIGNTSFTQNIFKNSTNGLSVKEVEFTLYNSRFDSITNTAIKVDGFNERNDAITLGGTAANQKLTISNCLTGIDISDDVIVKIKGNTFTNVRNGVLAYNCSDTIFANPVEVSNNIFTNAGTAIALNMNSYSKITVNSNTISATTDSAIGISIQDVKAITKANLTINNNIINPCRTGIYLNQAGKKGTLQGNSIYVSMPVVTGLKNYGIKNTNTDALTVSQNVLSADTLGIVKKYTIGMYHENVNQTTLSNNDFRYFDYGFNPNGTGNKPTFLKCNKFYACGQGVRLEGKGTIGVQGDSVANIAWQNMWEPVGWYSPTGNPIKYSVFAANNDGKLSPFFTLSGYPRQILTSGVSGTGVMIPATVIAGTGITCTLQPGLMNDEVLEASSDVGAVLPGSIRNAQPFSLTNKEINYYTTLAKKCPQEAGTGVYDARAILSCYFKSVIDYPNACEKLTTSEAQNLNGISDFEFSLFPNPAKEVVIVDFRSNIANAVIEFTNALGEIVYSEKVKQQSQYAIDISQLRAGVYICKIKVSGDVVSVKKFIVTQ